MKKNVPKSSTDTQRNHQLEQSNINNPFLDASYNSLSEGTAQKKANPFYNQSATNPFYDKIATNPFFTQTVNSPSLTSPIQKKGIDEKENNTGLPDKLKTGMENLSGISMDDVKVHHNSDKPAQLQAHAYAQGTDIHLASGQEEHLPHELAHVVQQKQGRVQPTTQIKGIGINDNEGLEQEADVMGTKALQLSSASNHPTQSVSSVNQVEVAPVQMKPNSNIFKRMAYASRRKKDKKLKGSLEKLDTGTASDVFKAETKGSIGKTGTNKGFAKKSIGKSDKYNDTSVNLGLVNEDYKHEVDPNLIARQVISSRLDKKLGLNVLSDEIFSKDEDGRTIGISGRVDGKQVMEGGSNTGYTYNNFDLSDPKVQKGLSDLQLIDAITGQLDRHMGNVFIDGATGSVKGIDNDMAFGRKESAFETELSPVLSSGNSLRNQFTTNEEDGSIRYNQTQVDKASAESVLAMSESDFKKILKGRSGDGEKIDSGAISMALIRFRAVKEQMQYLKDNEMLVSEWNDDTYDEALNSGVVDNENKGKKFENHTNYTARASREKALAGQGLKGEGFDVSNIPAVARVAEDINPPAPTKKKGRNPFKRNKKTKKQRTPEQEEYRRQELERILHEMGF